MPFDLDALCERLGSDRIAESFTEEIASTETAADRFSMRALSVDEVKALFPNVSLSDTEHIAYIPTRMCHSLPKVNKRGRGFFPSVLRRSASSAQDNLVDFEHMLKKHSRDEDRVIGHIKAVRFDPESMWDGKIYETANSKKPILPTAKIPLYALNAIFKRTETGEQIVQQLSGGRRKWKSSMECVVPPHHCGFIYDNTFVHTSDAPEAMLECVEKDCVRKYNGKDLILCLGGVDHSVDFVGSGFTISPADADCEALGILTSSYAQTASVARSMTLRAIRVGFPQENREQAVELASAEIERLMEEQAAIAVIGQTSEMDGHMHDVLSDGSIVPSNGHSHRVEHMILVPGTNPRFTAKLSDGERRSDSPGNQNGYFVHSHTVDIPLRGKKKSASSNATKPGEMASLGEDDEFLTNEDIMKFRDRVKALEDRLEKMSATPTSTELASIKEDLRAMRATEELAAAIDEGVQEKLTSGEFLTKEAADKAAADAAAEAKKKSDDEAAIREKRLQKNSERLAAITALGVNVDMVEEGETKSIKELVSSIEVDDRGDREFQAELRRHKAQVELLKKKEEPAEKEVATQQASTPRSYLLPVHGSTSQGGGAEKRGSRLPNHFATKRAMK